MATHQLSLDEAIEVFQLMEISVPKAVRACARRICADVAGEAIRNVDNDLVMRRTGSLARYVGAKLRIVHESGDTFSIGLPKGEKAAIIGRVQDSGQTINAKAGKSLRIPLPPALTAVGADRFAGVSLRDVSVNGQKFFRPKGHETVGISVNGKYEPWYLLRTQVTLKPRYWFKGAVMAVQGRISRHIQAVIPKALRPPFDVETP